MNFTGESPIALLAFLVNFKKTFETCDASEGKAVRILSYFRSEGVEEEFQACTANGMGTDAHV